MLNFFRFGRAAVLAIGLTLLLTPARAQVLDPSFQAVDMRALNPASGYWLVRALAADASGQVLVGGYYDFINGAAHGGLARLQPTGVPDATYNPGGSGANGIVDAILPLPNGQTLIGGSFSRYNGQAVGYVARLNANGTPDPAFNPGGSGADGQVLDMQLDAQGRILLGGLFSHYNGQFVGGLVRLLPNGTPDPTFAAPAATTGAVYSVTTDAAGNVLVGGFSLGATSAALIRLLPTGAEDPTFSPGGVGSGVRRVRVLPSGKLLIAGGLASYNGSPAWGILQLTATGAVDPSFTSPFQSGTVYEIIVLSTGQIVVGGGAIRPYGQSTSKRIWRLQPNGVLDASFTPPDITSQVYAMLPTPSGGLVIGGNFLMLNGQPAQGVARLSAAGIPDPTFASLAFQQYGEVRGLALQTGDRLVVSGNFGTLNGQAVGPVVRLTANGAPDPTFQPAPALSPTYFSPLLVEPTTDRILLKEYSNVRRLLPNGPLDTSFDDGLGISRTALGGGGLTRVLQQPDGKLLVSGGFTAYNSVVRTGLVRLTATGAVDPTFAPPVDSSRYVADIQLLPNGSVAALCHDFTTWQFQWFDANGTPLPGFNGGAPLTGVTAIMGLPDGTVLASGDYTLGGTLYQGVHKLTSAGTVDPSFVLDPSLTGQTFVFFRQPDGKLLFRDELARGHRVRRLLPTGALDAAFTPTEFGNGYRSHSDGPMVVQSTGNLVVGGGFSTVNGLLRPSLVRLLDIPNGLPADAPAGRALDVFPNPAHATFTLRRATTEPATATLVDVLGRPLRRWPLTATEQTVPLAGVTPGTYVLRVVSREGVVTRRVVVE